MSGYQSSSQDTWDVDPAENEKRKDKSLDLQVSYWDAKGNSDKFWCSKTEEEDEGPIIGALLDDDAVQKFWPPMDKALLKILNKEGVDLPKKTLLCQRRGTLHKPYIEEGLPEPLMKWLRQNGAGKNCASCRFSQKEEYDGDSVRSFCGAGRKLYMLTLEEDGTDSDGHTQWTPTGIRVVEAKSDKSIKAVDSYIASFPANRPLMSYLTSLAMVPFKSQSGSTFYKLALKRLGDTPIDLKDALQKSKDRMTGGKLLANSGSSGSGNDASDSPPRAATVSPEVKKPITEDVIEDIPF